MTTDTPSPRLRMALDRIKELEGVVERLRLVVNAANIVVSCHTAEGAYALHDALIDALNAVDAARKP